MAATFNDLWKLLYDHGSSDYYKRDAQEIWDGLEPERQQRLHDNIALRLSEGRFISYNPLQAIHDNLPCKRVARIDEPTNYNRSSLTPPAPIKPACYKGEWGMYTQQDIDLFNLKTKDKNDTV